jgi:hypothetical protein
LREHCDDRSKGDAASESKDSARKSRRRRGDDAEIAARPRARTAQNLRPSGVRAKQH